MTLTASRASAGEILSATIRTRAGGWEIPQLRSTWSSLCEIVP